MELVYRHYLAQFLHILALWSRHYLLLSPQGYVHNSCPYRTFTNGFSPVPKCILLRTGKVRGFLLFAQDQSRLLSRADR